MKVYLKPVINRDVSPNIMWKPASNVFIPDKCTDFFDLFVYEHQENPINDTMNENAWSCYLLISLLDIMLSLLLKKQFDVL